MNDTTYRALVLEDEPDTQQLTVRALATEGFGCSTACDGEEAATLTEETPFDLVVTDLRMPKRDGHALAIDLLSQPTRPSLIVLTGISEPRLAKDLVMRGVDDIMFKPIDYAAFAAKARAIVDRRLQGTASPSAELARDVARVISRRASDHTPSALHVPSVSAAELEARLEKVYKILPISGTALAVYKAAQMPDMSSLQLAATIQLDGSLAVEVLRLANSSFYNASGKRIGSLEAAVLLIGHNRVGEIALATHALRALTAHSLPWVDAALAWRRSIGAGIAVEQLIAQGGHQGVSDGLLFGAIVQSMGRVVLGSLFPEHYERMIGRCAGTAESLLDVENLVFPQNHAVIMSRLLGQWNIPPMVYVPLTYTLDDFGSLDRLTEPQQTRAKLIRLAGLIGQLAAGGWESWDSLEFPKADFVTGLGITDIARVLEQTRADLEAICSYQNIAAVPKAPIPDRRRPTTLTYGFLAPEPFDFLGEVLCAMGYELQPPADGKPQSKGLINALNAADKSALAGDGALGKTSPLVVCEADRCKQFFALGRAVTVPSSYGALQSMCAEALDNNRPTTGRVPFLSPFTNRR